MSLNNFFIHSYQKNNFFNSIDSKCNFSKGGVFLDDNLYGKCVLPHSEIIIYQEQTNQDYLSMKKSSIIDFFFQTCSLELPNLKIGEEKWYTLPHNFKIKSLDLQNNQMVLSPIHQLVCQMIQEPIKKIILDSGLELECTMAHRLLKVINERENIYFWESHIQENDIILVSQNTQNSNIVQKHRVKKVIIENYEGYVFDLVVPEFKNYVVNEIISHNTSLPVIQYPNAQYFKFSKKQFQKKINLIVCPSYRINFWKEKNTHMPVILNHKSHTLDTTILKEKGGIIICSYAYLENNLTKIGNLKIDTIKIDLIPSELEIKKMTSLWNHLDKLKAHTCWTIINYSSLLKENDELWGKIIKLYFRDGIYGTNQKLFFESSNTKNLKIKIKNIELKFSHRERNKYQSYLDKFNFIYEKNDILFQDDVYLQKFCSYPQSNLKINYFCLDKSADIEVYLQSQKLIQKLGNYSSILIKKLNLLQQQALTPSDFKNETLENEISNISNSKCKDLECNICLQPLNTRNLGITECGHLFCYSCLLKNMKYQKTCPRCRHNLENENIYLYIKSWEKTNLSYQHIIENCQDELNLGTKISSLVKLVMNLKKNKIIISNFDDNLKYIRDILTQFQIKSLIITSKNYQKIQDMKDENMVFLLNYKLKFFKLPPLSSLKAIICNEPFYHSESPTENKSIFLSKIKTLRAIYQKATIYNLYIQNTIESTQINTLLT